jgi:hypothetical protein
LNRTHVAASTSSLTIDEVRDPERVIEQEAGDFAPLASPQNLALERAWAFALLVDPHRRLHAFCLLRDAAVPLRKCSNIVTDPAYHQCFGRTLDGT